MEAGDEHPCADPTPPERNEGSQGTPDSILVITYDNNGSFVPNSLNVFNTLVNLGYTVTHLHHPADGVISGTLASATFQQVWLFDVNSFLQIGGSDASAIATWYNNNASAIYEHSSKQLTLGD